MKRRNTRWLAVAAGLVCCAVIVTLAVKLVSAQQTPHSARSTSTSPDAKVTIENGQVVIYLSKKAQQNLGLVEAPLQSARRGKQMTLPATVLAVANLQTLVSAYATASAQLQKAEITANVSREEYQRLKKLYGEQQNVSAKTVQAAEGVYQSNKVDVRLARENLSLAAGAIRQSWGETITGWVAHGASPLRKVLRRNDVLVEMTLPMGESISAPSGMKFDLPAGGRAYARRVSTFPQMDPRVQGVGYLYVTPSRPGLAPGLNLTARFSVGTLRNGVIVPASAVVWLHGEAWAYVAAGAGRFVRRSVKTDIPTSDGWFMAQEFKAGTPVVTEDAQQILAVELAAEEASKGKTRGGRR